MHAMQLTLDYACHPRGLHVHHRRPPPSPPPSSSFHSINNEESTHCKIGSKPHLTPRGFLSRVRPTSSN